MYDAFSNDYDRFVNWPARLAFELPFIEDQLRRLQPGAPGAPIRILDAACGTGQHALALAKKGFAVSGADLSEGMIARARENSSAAGMEIPFAVAGFDSLAGLYPPESFDALLCLGNSLPHLISRPNLGAALSAFARLLRPGGLLLVQNRNFDAVLARQERWMDPQSDRSEDTDRVFIRFYDFRPDGLISFNILTLRREKLGEWKQTITTTLLRPQTRAELVELAGRASFEEIEIFGSLDGSPFDPQNSGNLVLVGWNGKPATSTAS
ncbi:MAG TPA: class I SAM-dependent methyltransferase [Anaerolineaceae bacterium]|nr:class I SAM-dependent methyltransferase [Anaerolineaceae bacterium]